MLCGLGALPALKEVAAPFGPTYAPQAFGAVPDGVSDCTDPLQRTIDAAGQAGGRVVIAGGVFVITDEIALRRPGLALTGDGIIRAGRNFNRTPGKALLGVSARNVRIEGIGLDQDDRMIRGASIRAIRAAGLGVHGLSSRGTQYAFVVLGDECRDVEIVSCDHRGRGYGVIAPDSRGLARILIRDCIFEHPGDGSVGDGVELNCPTHGAEEVWLIDLVARGYVGEASNAGMGFGFARVRHSALVRVRAADCEGDGFHWENGSHDAIVLSCSAFRTGRRHPVGGNGSGFVAYDSDRWLGRDLEARNCWYHGIALSSPYGGRMAVGGRILNCRALGTGRDGLHIAGQRDFEISRCVVRDPSRCAAWRYAGIQIGWRGRRQAACRDGRGAGNAIELTGATRPLGGLVIHPESRDIRIETTLRRV
ncbi:MAG: hypothetical protein ACREH6_06285 [Geminicoccaceae bacterium]